MNFENIEAPVYLDGHEMENLYIDGHLVWEASKPLRFTSTEYNSTIKFTISGTSNPYFEYKLSGTNTWTQWVHDVVLTLDDGEYVEIKGNNPSGISSSLSNSTKFVMTGKFNSSGNLTTLLGNTMTIPSDGCFIGMFMNQTSLYSAPELGAININKKTNCLHSLFSGCTNLKEMPDISKLYNFGSGSCVSMFLGSGIERADKLPDLFDINENMIGTFQSIFKDCTSLTYIQDLDFKNAYQDSFRDMFRGCTALEESPNIRIRNSASSSTFSSCYGMFIGCTSLSKVGTLQMDVYATNMCQNYFTGCSSLHVVEDSTDPNDVLFLDYTNGIDGAAPGMFGSTAGPYTSNPRPGHKYYYKPFTGLTFEALQASTIKFVNNGTNNPDMKYRLNDGTWTQWSANTPITLSNVGDKLYVKGNNSNGFSHSNTNYTNFVMTGKIAASGNINSLLDNNYGSSITSLAGKSYCFLRLFSNCSKLTSVPKLPATTLAEHCYSDMFRGCTSLTSIPENLLPATTLADSCYREMFYGCTSLSNFNLVISATNLSGTYGVCCNMFDHAKLNNVNIEIMATELIQGLGTNDQPGSLRSMFIAGNFSNCTIKVHFTDWKYAYSDNVMPTKAWFYAITSSGTNKFICPSALPQYRDAQYIPSGWTIETF